ncbi:MAG: hypothetical protein A2408_02095 [Candidatus Yonathbacteria bacterium RIFOXYC1_FULL_52_10]|uniref:Uncharacterized protein n=1 Tax=Candidatus Yonathbacteria bacterium RIFOXYD1_FULL_52_36 TaxID=1802730 RepID=A0A1G2SLS5_9BACT|nr:MAG: hypothetical protein A2408_02095 [Candidatus Yonathbacteria bacterium RIFOXYC1_FULL_52_10]OHA86043.1 MAG: hypothetical protein A2591_01465 [Candidatus Yonathbacteria bacterium RIFOXYD1_FULL_52_36]
MSDLLSEIGTVSPDMFSSTDSLLSLYSFWSFVIVAVITSILVFVTATKMKGGLFGKVLYYFGAGMVLILISLVLVSIKEGSPASYTDVARDILNIVGFILMAIAANKLYSFTKAQ